MEAQGHAGTHRGQGGLSYPKPEGGYDQDGVWKDASLSISQAIFAICPGEHTVELSYWTVRVGDNLWMICTEMRFGMIYRQDLLGPPISAERATEFMQGLKELADEG
jgi:hypothetical protein